MRWDEAIGRRLARHHLLTPAPSNRLVEVASDVCGVHAQVGASAELMLGLRVRDITRQHVRSSLAESRTLVKTVGLRGTLHLFPAAELPDWMAAVRLRLPAEERRLSRLGIELDGFRSVISAIEAVVGPTPISRPEFERRLAERAGSWAMRTNQGWAGHYRNWPMALGWAAVNGKVCYGPANGGRITLVRLTDWCGWREVDPIDGGRFALHRFLRAYGPSTQREFSRWFALEPAITKQLFEALADELAEVLVEGERRWMLKADVGSADAFPHAIHLLPQFDVYTVGCHPRNQLIANDSPVAKASPGTAAPLAVLLIGGRVAGVWERRVKGKRLLVRIDAHQQLSRLQRSHAELQAYRVAELLQRDVEVEFGEIEIRPHL